jgi:hypothetical protein
MEDFRKLEEVKLAVDVKISSEESRVTKNVNFFLDLLALDTRSELCSRTKKTKLGFHIWISPSRDTFKKN